MTREELVHALNKIDGVEATKRSPDSRYGLQGFLEIVFKKEYLWVYYDNQDFIVGGGMVFKDRTEQQVLSVVKALVE